MKKRELSDEEKASFISMVEGGATQRGIRERFRCGSSSIDNWMSRFNLHYKNSAKSKGGKKRLSEEEVIEFKRGVENGMSQKELTDKWGSKDLVRRELMENGLRLKRGNYKPSIDRISHWVRSGYSPKDAMEELEKEGIKANYFTVNLWFKESRESGLAKGRYVERVPVSWNGKMHQVVMGTVLGDGYLRPSGMLCIRHGYMQGGYLKWKLDLCGGLFKNDLRVMGSCSPLVKWDYGGAVGWDAYSVTSDILEQYQKRFYFDGVKRLPLNVIKELDWLGFGIWFMDDGTHGGGNKTMCTLYGSGGEGVERWSEAEMNSAIDILNSKFGLSGKYREINNVPSIVWGVEDSRTISKKLAEVLIPLGLPKLMHYKLGIGDIYDKKGLVPDWDVLFESGSREELKKKVELHLESIGYDIESQRFLSTSKESIRFSMERLKGIRSEKILKRIGPLDRYKEFCEGVIDPHKIKPSIRVVESKFDRHLHDYATLQWSTPMEERTGRRVRFFVWDDYHDKLMGLISVGDTTMWSPVRDNWIGWDKSLRASRIGRVWEAYRLGATSLYSSFLGGKLISMLSTSSEVMKVISDRYDGFRPSLLTTMSAFGRSSIYNRLRFKDELLFKSIGYSAGYGTFHLLPLYDELNAFVESLGKGVEGRGRVVGKRLLVLKKALKELGFSTGIMKHGIEREFFVCPLAYNWRGAVVEDEEPQYIERPLEEIFEYWKFRYMAPRLNR